MDFNNTVFLFLFLPVFLAIYYIAPGKLKNVVLILFSLVFYTWGDNILVLLLLASAILNYLGAKFIRRGNRVAGLTAMLIFNIAILGYFKYYNFGVDSLNSILRMFTGNGAALHPVADLVLPLGISFYTFRAIAYVLDVYKGKTEPSANFLEFCTWFTLFPLVSAGPIVRYADIRDQLAVKNISADRFTEGVARFITGLAKKVLIAGTFSAIAQYVFATPMIRLSMAMSWTGIIAFTLEIYFDFSGYSDMAIGLGKMMGFDFKENFNYPYAARNIREFWRRWHISLSTWLRDYLFLPMAYSLSRKLKNDTYLHIKTDKLIYIVATLVTFLTCGLWHGAAWTYVAWGFYFAVFLILEQLFLGRLLKKLWIPFQHLYTMLVVTFSFVIFKSASLPDVFVYFGRMFSFSPGGPALNSYIRFYSFNRETLIMTIAAIIFSTPVYGYLRAYAGTPGKNRVALGNLMNVTAILILGILFIVSLSYLASHTYNPFIYLRF
ncbi:MAG: MBOAT family protein [Bacteroidetes bacterium]|nr:MBOAT family protein [Bacteroidota bacterium]